jgi:hypothetical protein
MIVDERVDELCGVFLVFDILVKIIAGVEFTGKCLFEIKLQFLHY